MRAFSALILMSALGGIAVADAPKPDRLGAEVMSLTPDLREYFGVARDRGVLVDHVEAGTPAAASGLLAGDVIVDISDKTIALPADIAVAVDKVGKRQVIAIAIVRAKAPLLLHASLLN
jgi:serine protease Do